MKYQLFIALIVLLNVCFSYLIKKKNIIINNNDNFYICNFVKDKKGRRKYNNNYNKKTLNGIKSIVNSGCVNQDVMRNVDEAYEGKKNLIEGNDLQKKFLQASKEDDYNYLYFYHIYKKMKLIKREKYIYNPTKYESVRSYIKRELKDCLDVNTSAYIFKLSEFYSKNVLEVSVYVNEIINILSFFTFNSEHNLKYNEKEENQNTTNDILDYNKKYVSDDMDDNAIHSTQNNSLNNQNKADTLVYDTTTIKDSNNNNDDDDDDENYNYVSDNIEDEHIHTDDNKDHSDIYPDNKILLEDDKKKISNEKNFYDQEKINSIIEKTKEQNNCNEQNLNDDDNIFKKYNENQSKMKFSKLINKDEKYKSFCFYFIRLVDSISGLFCTIAKRKKREEILNFLKNLKIMQNIKNYNINNLHFDTNFMIYIIRLTKYKDMNFLCSLKKLKEYKTEDIKKIFLNCLYDNLLDLYYLKNLQDDFIKRENEKKKKKNALTSQVFSNSFHTINKNGTDDNTYVTTNIKYENLRKIEEQYNDLLKQYSHEKIIKNNEIIYNENDLKNIIIQIFNKDIFKNKKKIINNMNNGTNKNLASQSGNNKKKKKKIATSTTNMNNISLIDIFEITEDKLYDILKNYPHLEINNNNNNIKMLIKKMNKLLESYNININIHLVKKDEMCVQEHNTLPYSNENKIEEQNKISDENKINEKKNKNIENKEEYKNTEPSNVKNVNFSNVSLSDIKKYISYKRSIEEQFRDYQVDELKLNNIKEEEQNKKLDSETINVKLNEINNNKLENNVELENEHINVQSENYKTNQKDEADVFKYFDITEKQNYITFEFNNYILEHQALLNEKHNQQLAEGGNIKDTPSYCYEPNEKLTDEQMEEILKKHFPENTEDAGNNNMEVQNGISGGENKGNLIDDDFSDDNISEDDAPRRKKEKIKENKEIEKLKSWFDNIDNKKYKYNFENIYYKTLEEKMEALLYILKNEKTKKKVIVCSADEEKKLIKMKCQIENVEYDYMLNNLKNIKHFINKENNYHEACFIFMKEIENTLELRKICTNLSEQDNMNNKENKNNKDHKNNQNDKNIMNRDNMTFYHFSENVPKSIVYKKLFYSITNNEDSYLFYLKSKNKNVKKEDDRKKGAKGNTKYPKSNGSNNNIFVPYHKRIKKKKLTKNEEKWLDFRRRTLKKIDEMKKKAELLKKKKAQKRDNKIKKIVAKLKAKNKKILKK
ncbi:hypothetical protein PFBG_01326 [Plasmodium falciparum 7G8]|uniref:Uncharacterized protein n=2 Tax=Plasmodium falciparum TaxID=5833 RepID=A0A024VA02_PLAFA|nr:hypothetical protein PFFVO_01323 [Plasmodium falciparum Vietnam Oak-Knoll (FVO)]EUR75585.1 hypothetical protein PFBG_01326 [Plasmodium falciparum 7G8]